MYYLKYLEKTDENLEIQNLKQTIEFAYDELCNKKVISIHLANRMHEILLNSVRGAKKAQENVIELLNNLYEYMNDAFIDPLLINVAISHAQFETIHAYKDGNGRVGRALIPIQMAMLEDGKPILYLSEVIELYKPSNQRNLMESRRGNLAGFIKFFLQCVIDQCTSYINKINRIKEIYKEDMKKIESFRGNSVFKIMPVIMRQIVFTKKEVEEESGVSVNVVSNIINKLVEIGILIKDSSVIKKGYRYQRIYDVFVGNHEYF